MKAKFTVLISAIFLAAVLVAVILNRRDNTDALRSWEAIEGSHLQKERQRGGLSSYGENESGQLAAGQQLFSSDFDTNLLAALRQGDAVQRRELLRQWAVTVGSGAMGKTLEQLEAIKEPGLRSEVRGILLSGWAERDVPGMADWFGKRFAADALHQQARDTLAQDLARRDPASMLAWMRESLPESVSGELYGPFFRQWGSVDPSAASIALNQMSEASRENPAQARQWNDMIAQVAVVWAGADGEQATDWVESLPDGAAKTKALALVGSRWGERDPQTAAAYAAGKNEPAMLKAVLSGWAEKNPAAAAAYAYGISPDQGRNEAVMSVIADWASMAPAQAAQWVWQFPESSMRGQAMAQLMNSWSEMDASAAGQWLQTLPQSHSRDVATSAYSGAIVQATPDAALQWAGGISDETLRDQSLRTVAFAWLAQDPQAARAGIGQSGLPEGIKRELLAGAVRR